jgi:anti-sigma-K factor RskA
MIDEQLQEQASLYVLGLLESPEAQAFEARLAGDTELRRHVDGLTENVAQLAHAAPQRPLPPELEARILAEIRATKTPVAFPVQRSSWIPWAIAAALAIACLVTFADRQRIATELTTARSENMQSQTQIAATAVEKQRIEQQLVELREREADARAQMATLADARTKAEKKIEEIEQRDELKKVQVAALTSKLADAPDATAAVVWDAERQRGVLNTANMPPNAANSDYQLWIVDPRFTDPVDAGVFTVNKNGGTKYFFTPKSRITSATAFAISLERKGGVPKAEGPIVLAGK